MTGNKITQNFIETNLTCNLKHLMQAKGIKTVELAEIVGVSAESISKLKNGAFHNPSLRVIAGISSFFNVTLDELIFGDLKSEKNDINTEAISYIPIISWDNIKNWKNESHTSSLLLKQIESNNVFALLMSHAQGIFLEDSFIIVDTSIKPSSNDYVLVLNIKNEIFNIKKLIIEDYYYLQSLMLEISTLVKHDPNEHLIFGVIIGYQKTKFFRCI